MRSFTINAGIVLLCLALFSCAAGYGMKRQEMWDTAISMNRCEQGFTAYCNDETGV